MTKAIVLGNGESRKNVNYRRDYSDYFVIGCNGAFKEDVDALVCNDAYMQYIIYDTGYCKDHACFFSEWTPIPIDIVDSVVESMGLPVIHNKNKRKNNNSCTAGIVFTAPKHILYLSLIHI